MKPSLKEQLAGAKLNFSAYGNLPNKEDVLAIKNDAIFNQWQKIVYLRKNLKVLNDYLQSNTDLIFNDWLAQNNIPGVSDNVTKAIGTYNNVTGGISSYFCNLQNFHDDEEKIYDGLEKTVIAPDTIRQDIDKLQTIRIDKRKNRVEERKTLLRDLKLDNKGYLIVDVEEAPEKSSVNSADATVNNTTKQVEIEKIKTKISTNKKIIGVCVVVILVCGTIIVINKFKAE